MRLLSLLALIFFASCSHHDAVYRNPASHVTEIVYGDHDPTRSSVREFPPQFEKGIVRHFYFVELRDENGKHIDRDLHEFEIRLGNKSVEKKIKRVLRGRYYLIAETKKDLRGNFDFYVVGSKLHQTFKVNLTQPDAQKSSMKKLEAHYAWAKLELVLKDKLGRPVDVQNEPEIMIEGDVLITKLERVGKGIWHIELGYPPGNQLYYVSVRSQGVYFKNLFRFQYIDI